MADVKQLITDFYKVAQKRDFARDFNFRLLSIQSTSSNVTFNEDDLVYIKTAQLPARAITNVPVPYMGLKFNVPGNATYPGSDAYSLTFYADATSEIRRKFEQWSRDIFDDATSTGNYFTPRSNSVISMAQLDQQNNMIALYKLVGVSLLECGPLDYKISEGTGNVVEFTAKISYHFWTRQAP